MSIFTFIYSRLYGAHIITSITKHCASMHTIGRTLGEGLIYSVIPISLANTGIRTNSLEIIRWHALRRPYAGTHMDGRSFSSIHFSTNAMSVNQKSIVQSTALDTIQWKRGGAQAIC